MTENPRSYITQGRMALCLAAALAAGLLSQRAAAQSSLSMYTDPSKYLLYGCPQLAQARPPIVDRMQVLEKLMAKAEAGPGGALVNAMAYRNEYLGLEGDLENLDARARDRNCPPMPQGGSKPPNEPPAAAPQQQRRQRPSR